MVTEAETLRSIQTSHGLTGAFNDKRLSEWLMRHNTTDMAYKKVNAYVLYRLSLPLILCLCIDVNITHFSEMILDIILSNILSVSKLMVAASVINNGQSNKLITL